MNEREKKLNPPIAFGQQQINGSIYQYHKSNVGNIFNFRKYFVIVCIDVYDRPYILRNTLLFLKIERRKISFLSTFLCIILLFIYLCRLVLHLNFVCENLCIFVLNF